MNIRHLLTVFLIPIIGSVQAETVYIDNYFLAKKLEEIVPGCIVDRELDTECADLATITTLVLNDAALEDIRDDVFSEHEGALSGLEYLTELADLTLIINKLSLEVNSSDLPNQLKSFKVQSNNLDNIESEIDILSVTVNGLPNSVKKLTIYGGREESYYFGVHVHNLPDSIEEIETSCFYLELGILPASVRKISISHGSELHKWKLNEGLRELKIQELTFYHEEGLSEPLLPAFPSTLKTVEFDGLYLYDVEWFILGEEFYKSNFIFNEGLETIVIKNALWFNIVNYPSTLKYLEYVETNGSLLGVLPEGLETLKYNNNYNYLGTFSFPSTLKRLELRSCGIEIAPKLNEGLQVYDISDNKISRINFHEIPSSLEELYAINCFLSMDNNGEVDQTLFRKNLKKLILDSNLDVECLPLLPKTLEELSIIGTEVTCIPNETDYIKATSELPVCSKTCGASIGDDTYTGRVFLNLVGGWEFEEGDIPVAGAIIQTDKGNIITDNEGKYSITLEPFEILQYKIEYYHPLLNKTYHPDNIVVEDRFEHNGVGEIHEGFDFAVYLINADDLEVSGSSNKAKPGFDNVTRFTVTNFGATAENNARLAIQKPSDWTYQFSSPVATTVTSDSIIWENISLIPLQSRTFTVTSTLPATSTILGELYTFTAKVTPLENDMYPQNNIFVLTDTIRGAYDPNDKQVYPSQIQPEYAEGEKFIYTIRFQNTGTDTATFVYILDTIQSGLIAGSIHIIDSSHAMTWVPLEGGIMRFDFQNIQLPDSTADPIGSQGFVTFSIIPESNMPAGTVFSNRAAIYFDFNEPVITNTATSEVSVPTFVAQRSSFTSRIYPNPAKSTTRIEWSESGKSTVSLIDISGRIIYQNNTTNTYQDIPLEKLSSGLYFVKVNIGSQTSIIKLIVE